MSSRLQGSLEYIILIGGIIILAAASYFMLKGFSQTSTGETTENIGVVGEKYRLELDNLGRSQVKFFTRRWPSISRQHLLTLTFDCFDNLVLNSTNLSGHGIDVSTLSFYCFGSDFCEVNHTLAGDVITVNSLDSCCSDPLKLHMFFDEQTSLDNPHSLNYSISCSLTDCELTTRTDFTPPSISISTTAFGSEGSVRNADIAVEINGTGSLFSLVQFRIGNSGWVTADNQYYEFDTESYGTIKAEAHTEDGNYNSEYEILHITIQVLDSEGDYTVGVKARDVWGNEAEEEENVSVQVEGGAGECCAGWLQCCCKAAVNLDGKTTFEQTDNLTCGCDSPIGSNLILNPGFENGLDNWTSDSGIPEVTTSFPCSGSQCLNMSNETVDRIDQKLAGKINSISGKYYIPSPSGPDYASVIILAFNTTYGELFDIEFLPLYHLFSAQGEYQDWCGIYIMDLFYIDCTYASSTHDSWVAFNITNISNYFKTYFSENNYLTSLLGTDVFWEDVVDVSIMLVTDGNQTTYTTYFDNISAFVHPEGYPCDSGNDDGVADGLCWMGECVPIPISALKINPVHRSRHGEINVSAKFRNITGVDSCTLKVGAYEQTMAKQGQNATHSISPYEFTEGTNTVNVTCTGGTYTGSAVKDIFVMNWEPSARLAYDPSYSDLIPSIAVSGSNVHVVWANDSGAYYKNSSDNGAGWSEDYQLASDARSPSIAVSGPNVHVVWKNASFYYIHYRNSSDGGTSWNPIYQLNVVGVNPKIAVNELSVHVVSRFSGINYRNSSDGGTSWSQDYQLASDALNPSIAVSGSNVHVVWANDSGAYYKNSSDNGAGWSEDYQLASDARSPSIAVSGPNVHVVWENTSSYYIQYTNSSDGGTSWNPAYKRIHRGENPAIAVSGSDVHVVWERGAVWYMKSSNSGTAWSDYYAINSLPSKNAILDIAVSGPYVHAVWREKGEPYSIYYTRYNPN